MRKYQKIAAVLLIAGLLGTSGCGVSKEARQDRSAGIVKMNNGEFSGAAESFRAAYNKTGKLSPGFRKDVLKYLSEAEFRGGDYESAVETYDTLLEVDGDKAEYWYFRAAAEAELGNIDEAKESFENGRKKGGADTPGAETALSAIAALMESEDSYDDLSALAEDLISSGWTIPEVYNIQGVCAAEKEDYDAAAEAFANAAAAVTDSTPDQVAAEVRRNQGALAEKQGNFEEALAIFREVLENYGGDENLKKEIIFLKTRVGDTTEDDFSNITEETEISTEAESSESESGSESGTEESESESSAEESESGAKESTGEN